MRRTKKKLPPTVLKVSQATSIFHETIVGLKAITVRLPVVPHDELRGFHQTICTAEFGDGGEAEVSGGLGLGHTEIYVAIDGKRVLAVDCMPMFKALIDAALKKALIDTAVKRLQSPKKGG